MNDYFMTTPIEEELRQAVKFPSGVTDISGTEVNPQVVQFIVDSSIEAILPVVQRLEAEIERLKDQLLVCKVAGLNLKAELHRGLPQEGEKP